MIFKFRSQNTSNARYSYISKQRKALSNKTAAFSVSLKSDTYNPYNQSMLSENVRPHLPYHKINTENNLSIVKRNTNYYIRWAPASPAPTSTWNYYNYTLTPSIING